MDLGESTVLKDFQKEIEEMDEDDARLKIIRELDTINKKRERVFDHFWSLEEQQTILGLLKAKKMRKGNKTT